MYEIYAGFTAYEDTGWFDVSFSTDSSIVKCLKLIFYELDQLKHSITKDEFMDVRSNLLEWTKNKENDYEWLFGNFSNELCYTNKITPIHEMIQQYKQVTINDVYKVSQELFTIDQCSMCYSSKQNINQEIYEYINTINKGTSSEKTKHKKRTISKNNF